MTYALIVSAYLSVHGSQSFSVYTLPACWSAGVEKSPIAAKDETTPIALTPARKCLQPGRKCRLTVDLGGLLHDVGSTLDGRVSVRGPGFTLEMPWRSTVGNLTSVFRVKIKPNSTYSIDTFERIGEIA